MSKVVLVLNLALWWSILSMDEVSSKRTCVSLKDGYNNDNKGSCSLLCLLTNCNVHSLLTELSFNWWLPGCKEDELPTPLFTFLELPVSRLKHAYFWHFNFKSVKLTANIRLTAGRLDRRMYPTAKSSVMEYCSNSSRLQLTPDCIPVASHSK